MPLKQDHIFIISMIETSRTVCASVGNDDDNTVTD
jgi:hypothetical protein